MTARRRIIIPSLYLPPGALLFYLKEDEIFQDESENWQKQSLRNRTLILGANGPLTLSVPVIHPGRIGAKTRDIRISYAENWTRVHKGALFSAYNTSPFFSYFRDELFMIYDSKPVFLVDLNNALNSLLLKKLKIPPFGRGDIPGFEDCIDLRPHCTTNRLSNLIPPLPPYQQVFSYKMPFIPGLSCIDLLANTASFQRS